LRRSQPAADPAAALSRPAAAAAPAPAAGLSNTERNEMKKLDKEIAALEARKKEILGQFDSGTLSPEAASRLSTELGQVQESLDMKEMRWLELADRA
ncbi:MAG TPA: ABC transporter C-terminal domain-containing protein, partial [Saprospiraceae bacterium]|nr:ABC transporter C-terminal domain-containing protein [Saprospiraceae bacterium]